jgi:hypothetical protein
MHVLSVISIAVGVARIRFGAITYYCSEMLKWRSDRSNAGNDDPTFPPQRASPRITALPVIELPMQTLPAIPLQILRSLTLRQPTAVGRPAFLAAASGLVWQDGHFYVIADDELQLAVFTDEMQLPGTTLPLLDGALPLAAKARKRAKPDFETLTWLPPVAAQPHGALLALGSGSRANRMHGVQLSFDARATPGNAPARFDCAPLYKALEREFGIVNIEGAVVQKDRMQRDRLLLLQRGNKTDGINALVYLDLERFRRDCGRGQVDAEALIEIQRCELGAVDGVALGFTDAVCLPDGQLLALAVAEDTDDPYADGATLGSYLCRFDSRNIPQALAALDAPAKTEGIALWTGAPGEPLLVFVTDADDAAIPAVLLAAPLAGVL